MRHWLIASAVLAQLGSAAYAQEVMDGSDKLVPRQYLDILRVVVGDGKTESRR